MDSPPTTTPATPTRQTVIAALRTRLAQECGKHEQTGEVISSGCDELDRLMSRRGFEQGTLVDWLYANRGNGAGMLALVAARQALSHDTSLVVIDPERQFYPPAAAALGIDLGQMVLVHPASEKDLLWTWEQSLRSSAVAAVWGLLSRVEARAYRRLQLAAETGSAMGHLIRPAHLRSQPSWSHTQLVVEAGTRLRVTLTRARHGRIGQSVEIETPNTRFSNASIPFPRTPPLANPALERGIGA